MIDKPPLGPAKLSLSCLWCGKPFTSRRGGGSRQTFCCARHRVAFHGAARRWAERAVASGRLSIPELRNGDPAACTLLSGRISGAEVLQPPDDPLAPLVDLLGDIFDRLSVDQLAALPDPVWALIDYIVDPDHDAASA